jgi:hypothetical protein
MSRRVLHVGLLSFSLLYAQVSHSRSPLTDSLDVRISPNNESESSVFVSPLDPNVVLVSNNVLGGAGMGQSGWISTDGGKTWTHAAPVGLGGDPAAAISGNTSFTPNGRFVILGFQGALQGTQFKNTPEDVWDSSTVSFVEPTDKGHLWVDNSQFSDLDLRRFNLYAAWREGSEIDVARSTMALFLGRCRITTSSIPRIRTSSTTPSTCKRGGRVSSISPGPR